MNSISEHPVTNPSDGTLVGSVPIDGHDAAMAKMDRAFALFQDRARHLPLHERIALLEKLTVAMQRDKASFLETMVREGGKPWRDSQVEFQRALQGVKLAISAAKEHVGSAIPLGYQASSAGRIATTRVFPRGVVLAFSAFNHPLNLIVHQVIPAFATGCPCVVKPASDTPLSCLKLVELMHDVGVPSDYIQFTLPTDLEVASRMVERDDYAFFSFIGSAKVGWMLRSRLKPGVRCALEHGGVAPCLVAESADLDRAIPALTKGAFYHAGQVCVSTQRIYVARSLVKRFVEMLEDSAEALVVGDARDAKTDVGPLIRAAEVDRVEAWVQEAVTAGAVCVTGGERMVGQFYRPTVLLDPPGNAKVTTHEIFGPVVCVYSYDAFSSALDRANHPDFAFQAAVFTQDIDEILQAHDRIEASAIMVNDHSAFRDDIMPFAGLKASGHGIGGIPYTMEDMQYEKMLVLKG